MAVSNSVAERLTCQRVATELRRWILKMTSAAGSGHPTSSLSAVELMVQLFFGGHFRFSIDSPEHPNNDRLIFSKGHASPLFYSLWSAAGAFPSEQLLEYRQYGTRLEGHPTSRFRFTEGATGSLGQGLSIGLGMALAAKQDALSYRTFVLLGDSEMAEGAQWEAIQLASYYRLNNLVGILDVNRLGQRGQTMAGYDLDTYRRRLEAFDWDEIVVEDGHDLESIDAAYREACRAGEKPTMIIAKTVKGKGVSFLENKPGWHGKALDEDELENALDELGDEEAGEVPPLQMPKEKSAASTTAKQAEPLEYELDDQVATRNGYGQALRRLGSQYPQVVSLDGEVSNSTRAKFFAEAFPDRFVEMFIAEQNMVGVAVGLAERGKIPFVSTFAAFLTRAFDQIRMAQYSDTNIKFCGSHCGVSIGQDGPSQMGLEDIAMFRAIQNSTILYPSDAVATERLVEEMINHRGIDYLRTTRGKTAVIYDADEQFPIGGSKVLRQHDEDRFALIAAGVTLHEALKAHEQLLDDGIRCRVIDLYSIKPMDHATVHKAADDTELIITIEDHVPEGGLGEAVLTSLADHKIPVHCLAVRKRPLSGAPGKQLEAQGLSAAGIVTAVRKASGVRSIND